MVDAPSTNLCTAEGEEGAYGRDESYLTVFPQQDCAQSSTQSQAHGPDHPRPTHQHRVLHNANPLQDKPMKATPTNHTQTHTMARLIRFPELRGLCRTTYTMDASALRIKRKMARGRWWSKPYAQNREPERSTLVTTTASSGGVSLKQLYSHTKLQSQTRRLTFEGLFFQRASQTACPRPSPFGQKIYLKNILNKAHRAD